jgi:hypothetical protein
MKKYLFLLFFSLSLVHAQTCTYSFDKGIQVQWTAFKTPLKVGVSGSFDEVVLSTKKAQSLKELLTNSSAKIKTRSANTKNNSRDATLNEFFFKPFGQTIEAKVVDVELSRKLVKVELIIAGVKRVIPLRYTLTNDLLEAKGIIDIMDFEGKTALDSIHKTCYDLHAGKTWSDVQIAFTANVAKKCQ